MFQLLLNFLFPANKIIANDAEVLNLKSSAYKEVLKYFHERIVDSVDYVDPIAPNYFTLGSLPTVDEEEMVITTKAVENLPVGNIGDGVAVNVKAARVLGIHTALNCQVQHYSIFQIASICFNNYFLSKANGLFVNRNLDSLELIVDFKYIYI